MSELFRQQYHLEPDRGLLNDPNGLCWFNGKYHVFFQWNRFEKDHSYKEWGLFTSEDMLKWKFEGSAIVPDQEYDRDGVYSGSGYVINDQLYLFYTGNNKKSGKRKSCQCLVVTEDGRKYQKKGVILETPNVFTEHFRDPKVIQGKNSDFYMLVGAQQKNGKGAIALCYSNNGEIWKYEHMLAVSQQYEMIECPDMFELDGKYVLVFNPQKRDNKADEQIYSFSAYKVGEFNEESRTISDEDLDKDFNFMDAGFDFYAPQTFLSPDGRRILFAWMSRMDDVQEKMFSQNEPSIHCLTLPRELFRRGNKIYQRPIKELYDLLGRKVELHYEDGRRKADLKTRAFFMNIKRTDEVQNFDILFYQGEIIINYDSVENKLNFSRRNWIGNDMDVKTTVIDKCQELEIWSDNSSIEVFINGGQVVFSARVFPNGRRSEIVVDDLAKTTEIELREIESIEKKEEHNYE